MTGEGRGGGIGDACRGDDTGAQSPGRGQFRDSGQVQVAAGAGGDAAATGGDAGGDAGSGIGRISDIHRGAILLVLDSQHPDGRAQRQFVQQQLSARAAQVVAGDADLLVVHAITDDQDHVARRGAGSGRRCRGGKKLATQDNGGDEKTHIAIRSRSGRKAARRAAPVRIMHQARCGCPPAR